jgi:hypothetical protein
VSGVPIITQSKYCFLSAVQDGSSRVFTRDRRLWSPDTRNKPNSEGIYKNYDGKTDNCHMVFYPEI